MSKPARYFLRKIKEIINRRNVRYVVTLLISIIVFNNFFEKGSKTFVVKNIDLKDTPQRYVNQSEEDKPWQQILLWTPYFGHHEEWKKIFRRHINKECDEYRCKIFSDRKRYLEANAILFNANDLEQKPSLLNIFRQKFVFPKKRIESQIYIFFSFEPPPNMDMIDLRIYNHFFNWTMSYRTDSDVYAPYAQVMNIDNEDPVSRFVPSKAEDLKNKKMVAWMVSHCPTDSKREELVKELQRYITVDVYGKCGPLRCGVATTLPRLIPGATDPCDNVTKNYIFYLSLENALCKDYVTEKFFRSLKLGVIPVVLGGVNYSSFAPPKSYIDVKDFDSIGALAEYMKKVAADINLYNEYFKWKDHHHIEIGHPYKPLVCELCKKLHTADLARESKTYEDIHKWYSENALCHAWEG